MRKAFALVLALCLFAVPALGEELDLSAMTLDELQALHSQIDAEINARTDCAAKEGYNGILIGGKTIKVGTYRLKCLNEVGLTIWPTEEIFNRDGGSGREYIFRKTVAQGDTLLIHFSEGTVGVIIDGSVSIEPVTEEWVPTVTE